MNLSEFITNTTTTISTSSTTQQPLNIINDKEPFKREQMGDQSDEETEATINEYGSLLSNNNKNNNRKLRLPFSTKSITMCQGTLNQLNQRDQLDQKDQSILLTTKSYIS